MRINKLLVWNPQSSRAARCASAAAAGTTFGAIGKNYAMGCSHMVPEQQHSKALQAHVTLFMVTGGCLPTREWIF